jgi:hypothetical protein
MTSQPYCRHCGHPSHRADCGVDDCGCTKYEPRLRRDDRQRTWIVRVAFFEKNRWTPDVEVRVRAQGIGGAAQRAVREVKHQRESKRRVLQTRITVVPVPRGRHAN